MTTEIPTYEIGELSAFDLKIKHPDNPLPVTFESGNPVFDGCRLYPDLGIVGNPSLFYGPGSMRYEITGAQVNSPDNNPTPIPIDPKTYIDNYGYIHIGDSNMNSFDANHIPNSGTWIEIVFTATYHYINPSTGDVVSESWGSGTLKPVLNPFKAVGDYCRGISYSPLPSNSNIDGD